MKSRNKKDSYIAAAVTFAVALLLLLWLFFGGMTFDRAQLASLSTAEITNPDDELFIEPEIVSNLGEPDATENVEPAPAFKGEPELSEVENTKQSIPGKSEKPAPPVEKKVTQKTPSEVTATEPSKNDEDKKKVTSAMANKFSSQNGSSTGTNGNTGAGGAGVGINGTASGRTFIGCPAPKVELQNTVVVVVNVTINANGKVTKATARSKSGKASQAILNACQKAAMQAKWNEDKDTPTANGTITFKITPK